MSRTSQSSHARTPAEGKHTSANNGFTIVYYSYVETSLNFCVCRCTLMFAIFCVIGFYLRPRLKTIPLMWLFEQRSVKTFGSLKINIITFICVNKIIKNSRLCTSPFCWLK